jgi:lipopolysaccharide heptosyltransferase II
LPGIRSRAIGIGTRLAGLPWRLRPGRGRPLSPADRRLQRVVVVKPCCMGDLLMSTPAITALRKALPNSHISLAVGEWSRPALANNPHLNSLIDSPVGGAGTIPASYLRLARQIRRGRYGAAMVLDRSPLLNLVPYLAGVPVRAGLNSDGRGLALTHPVNCPASRSRHEVEWYLDVVRALGLPTPPENAYLEFYPTQDDREHAARALSEAVGEEGESEAGCVAIHLGGGSNPGMRLLSKRWQPERWARIADWLAETYEPSILLLGGPGKEDREAAEALKSVLFPATRPYVADLVGRLEWGSMAALVERCGLFLGHDTGAMHLATAMRTPVVAVFGPSDPARYGPWDPSGRSMAVAPKRATLDAEALRQASLNSNQLYHSEVTVEEVWAAVEKVYAKGLSRERVRA